MITPQNQVPLRTWGLWIRGRSWRRQCVQPGKAFRLPYGGDPTPQEQILIDRIVYKLTRCTLFEVSALSTEPGRSDHQYLAWANSLRLDLKALGLDRRSAEVADLKSYLKDAK